MITECWAIVIVILAMCYIFLRARKPEYSVAILPLILVPLSHLLAFSTGSANKLRWTIVLWASAST